MESNLPGSKVFLARDKQIAKNKQQQQQQNPEEAAYNQLGNLPPCLFQECQGDHKQSCFGSLATHSSGFCRPHYTQSAQKFAGARDDPIFALVALARASSTCQPHEGSN